MTLMPNITPAGASPAGPKDVRANLAFLHSSVAASATRSGGHDAGAQMRQLASWTPPLRSVDSDTLPDIDNSKARARDLARNDPFAANAARIDRDSVVGPGLRLSLKPDHVLLGIDAAKAREWARMVERRWEVYANSTGHHADARRMQSFNQLTRTMESSLFHDGEALATVIWRKPKRGQSAGTCFQLVSTDRLSNPYWLFDNPKLRKGIERNRWGEPVAYFIREAHPSDGEFGEWEKTVRWRKIRRQSPEGRRNVIHVFDHKHAEMTRGITDFTSAIKAMKMRGHYADATLERAIIQSFFAASIKTNLNYDQAMQVMGASFGAKVREAKNPMTAMTIDHVRQAGAYHKASNHSFGGAATMHLLPNEDVELHRSEAADGNFEKFEKSVLRQIAAGTGTPITALSQNYSDVNYSAARSALQDVWRHYMAKREMLIHGWMWPAVDASRFVGSLSGGGAYSVERGAAIIPVMGTLVNRGAWTGAYSGMTSYEGLEASINRALVDDAVSRIILDINSPGGEATGMARIAETVRRAKAKKPVIALVNDMAASAAYAIASQTDKILISETSLVGSIGVLWVHFDHSKALAEKGVKPTIIHAGARKVDGNPYGPLPDAARAGIEDEINSIYAVFIGQVIKGRSSLSVDEVREQEARTFTGRAAIDNGLADAMGNIEDAISMDLGGSIMSDNLAPAASAGISQKDHDEAITAARTEGAFEATDRIKAIFALKETQGREASAQVFALETDMSPEAAAKALAATPKVEPSNDSKTDDKLVAAAKIAAAGASNIVGPDDVAEPPRQAVIDTDEIYASRRI